MLNSFWGKFGQRSNMSQVDFVDEPTIYFDKLTSDQEDVTAVNFVSDDMVEMRWRYKNDFIEINSKTNVIIAAYTTAQARLILCSYLEQFGPRVFYADTDSIIFSIKQKEWKPPMSDYLGDLTNEVPQNKILTFVSGGPKNYAYQIQKADKLGNNTVCKITGKKFTKCQFQCINPFPNNPWFLRVCSTSLLKTLWEKEKLLITSNFSFSHSVFYPFEELLPFLSNLKLLSANSFCLEESKICRLGKG